MDRLLFSLLASLILLSSRTTDACSDLLVTPGASVDGSAILSYNADSPTLFGSVYHYPATTASGSTAETQSIYDWDSGVYLGEIAAASGDTFNVIGNTNERGLVIGESTFGGVAPLAWNQTGAIMDYGSLIYITLQRAETARQAIQVMADLVDTYGYASGGESFSIADRTGEVWMMELIGTGNDYGRMGAVYVAVKLPHGVVAAHANQARIQTFPRNDPENCLYAPDVMDVAVFYGLYEYPDDDPEGLQFSFSDTYHPITFLGARQGDARVWSLFSQLADSNHEFEAQYEAYASGRDLSQRMPLYVTPYKKLSLQDVATFMSSHYEDMALDSSKDVGAGLFETPYRPRPLVWEYGDNGQHYHNERSVATAKSGWSILMQVRPWMPVELSSILWFAADDSSTSPRVPIYSSSTRVHPAYAGQGSQDGVVTPVMQFDIRKAFWIQNMVANWAYFRWTDVFPILQDKLKSVQQHFEEQVQATDKAALQLYSDVGAERAVDFVTNFSVQAQAELQAEWTTFYGELFAQFRDYYTIVPDASDPVCNCQAHEPGLSDAMKRRIIDETGDRYKVFDDEAAACQQEGCHPGLLQGEAGPPRRAKEETLSTQ